jgi:hypothetical protein
VIDPLRAKIFHLAAYLFRSGQQQPRDSLLSGHGLDQSVLFSTVVLKATIFHAEFHSKQNGCCAASVNLDGFTSLFIEDGETPS